MYPAGQYRRINFGDRGHNLLCCYYYTSYWQPLPTNTGWLECGRMGNRDLPTWLMPDLMRPLVSYTRNNLFHLLAGGVRGLSGVAGGQRSGGRTFLGLFSGGRFARQPRRFSSGVNQGHRPRFADRHFLRWRPTSHRAFRTL